MKPYTMSLGIFALTVAAFAAGSASAEDRDWMKYDCSVAVDSTQFSLIVGGASGGGKLTCGDKTYDFKLSGMSFGANVGITKTEANGFVYDLKGDVSKFPGTYTQFSASGALGGGAGTVYLKNENGVVMTLGTKAEGVQLNVGTAAGVKVTMK